MNTCFFSGFSSRNSKLFNLTAFYIQLSATHCIDFCCILGGFFGQWFIIPRFSSVLSWWTWGCIAHLQFGSASNWTAVLQMHKNSSQHLFNLCIVLFLKTVGTKSLYHTVQLLGIWHFFSFFWWILQKSLSHKLTGVDFLKFWCSKLAEKHA